MFIGLYTSDQEKEKAIKEAIKKIDPDTEILDSDNCLEFTWDQEYLKESIRYKLGNIDENEMKSVLKYIIDDFLKSDFPAMNEEVEVFIDESIQNYKDSRDCE